jgi:uncharacterized OB-fold protein
VGVPTPRPDFRILPRIRDDNEFFWTSGADGRLRFMRCGSCGFWIHPSSPVCPVCHSRDLAPQAVAGEAVLHTYTVNHQAWLPGFEPPYVIAIVELPEQEGLRLTTNLVNCALEDVQIGMPVRVLFEQWEDVWLPLFEPA